MTAEIESLLLNFVKHAQEERPGEEDNCMVVEKIDLEDGDSSLRADSFLDNMVEMHVRM